MRRRQFIALLGGAAAAWPLAARAQQGERMRRIGVLLPAATDDSEFQARLAAFQLEFAAIGLDHRKQHAHRHPLGRRQCRPNSQRRGRAELVELAPDVILAHGSSSVRSLLEATRTLPIVFPIVGDPVGAGFVASHD
jgi:putative tryptophan/tyrosine transport system substrate-binding protein